MSKFSDSEELWSERLSKKQKELNELVKLQKKFKDDNTNAVV